MNYTRETSELDKKAIQIGVLVENHPCNATIEDISFMLNDEGTRSREDHVKYYTSEQMQHIKEDFGESLHWIQAVFDQWCWREQDDKKSIRKEDRIIN